MKTSSAFGFALLALSAAACSSSGSSGTPDPMADVDVVKSAAARNTSPTLAPGEITTFTSDQAAFAVDLYHAVRKDPGAADKDVFLSPHSVSIALAMLYAGARADSHAEMKQALHFGLSDDRLHTAFDWLDLALMSRGQNAKAKDGQPFRVRVANSIWGQKGYAFEQPYLDTLAVSYGAGLNAVDFVKNPDGASDAINAWVEDKTEKRIKDLVPKGSLDPDTRMVLVNAVYFNAAWQMKFQASATQQAPFTKLDGTTVSVAMMHDASERPYLAGEDFQAVELAYDGGEMSMLVIAPTKGTFATFESSLTGGKVLDILAGLKPRTVRLGFPKVKLDGSYGLTPALSSLGMRKAFDPSAADLTGIAKDRLFVKDVLHKTFLELDENGTEAAAATAVIAGTTSAPVDPPAEMTVDRPYFTAIVDRATKTLVFFGRILAPKAS